MCNVSLLLIKFPVDSYSFPIVPINKLAKMWVHVLNEFLVPVAVYSISETLCNYRRDVVVILSLSSSIHLFSIFEIIDSTLNY